MLLEEIDNQLAQGERPNFIFRPRSKPPRRSLGSHAGSSRANRVWGCGCTRRDEYGASRDALPLRRATLGRGKHFRAAERSRSSCWISAEGKNELLSSEGPVRVTLDAWQRAGERLR